MKNVDFGFVKKKFSNEYSKIESELSNQIRDLKEHLLNAQKIEELLSQNVSEFEQKNIQNLVAIIKS